MDKAIARKFSNFVLNTVVYNAIPIDKQRELKDEAKYPSIAFKRIDRNYDTKRFSLLGYAETMSIDVVDDKGVIIGNEVYRAPQPYNFLYQIEVVAKELYHIDCLEMFVEGLLNPRGDVLPISYKDLDSGELVNDSFPISRADYHSIDDEVLNIYRRVFTYRVTTSIDFNILVSHSSVAKSVSVNYIP